MPNSVVLNAAWQLGHNKELFALACADADVAMACELLADGGKTVVDVRTVLPAGWASNQNQNRTSPAKAGSAVCWDTATMELVEHLPMVRVSEEVDGEVRARYLSAVRLRDKRTGDVRPYAAAHAPLLSTGQKAVFYRNLREWAGHHPRAVIGIDGNASPARVSKLVNRPTRGGEVMVLILPVGGLRAGAALVDHRGEPHWTDHPIIRTRLTPIKRHKPKAKEKSVATSANGYPVIFKNDQSKYPRLRKTIIPGTGRHIFFRDGSVAFLLAHFLLWFHETIEPINNKIWDDWGWAVRPVRGKSSGYSNHASGTAFDVNATLHPLGKRMTFRPWQYVKMRARLALYAGCIRLGIDYKSRPDEMHGEINKSLAVCEKVARGLMKTPRGKRVLAANPGLKEVILS